MAALLVGATFFAPRCATAQQSKDFTADQIAESVILISGSRPALAQVRKTGVETGRITRMASEGRAEEVRYIRRFTTAEKMEKDKIRVDQKTPQAEYTLIKNGERVFGVINGAPFTPRAETTAEFMSHQTRSLDALLRYKENDGKVTSAGKDKQQGLELYVLDLIDKANNKTRYFISVRSLRVLWLEYEETPPEQSTPVKYMKRFYDYRYAQNTLVPYRTVVYVDGKQVLETRVMTVTYGVRTDDAIFQHPDAATGGMN